VIIVVSLTEDEATSAAKPEFVLFVYSFQFPTMQQIGEDLIHVVDQLK